MICYGISLTVCGWVGIVMVVEVMQTGVWRYSFVPGISEHMRYICANDIYQ